LGAVKGNQLFRKGKRPYYIENLCCFKRKTAAGACTQRRTAVIMIIIIPWLALVDHLMYSFPGV
jgi:hypothetical protein